MNVTQYINVAEFMAHLRAEGLVIVDATELAESAAFRLREKRRLALMKPALTFKEIIDLELLPVRTKRGIQSWVDTGKFKKGEVMTKGRTRKILVSALKRLGVVE